jgi:glycerol kinase
MKMGFTSHNPGYILALDLGTTGNRGFLFDVEGNIVSQSYKELTQYYPQPGWLEHDPNKIWQDTCWIMQTVVQKANIEPSQIAAIGLTVQRETCLLWDKNTGQPLHNAIVWQDRRTAPLCNQLREQGYAEEIYDRTGLVLDAYFSATKLAWLLERVLPNQPEVHLENVLAGTIDSWVLWNLTGRQVHATDHSNASRTMLMNLTSLQWDDKLLELFGIPAHLMPRILPSLGEFGVTDAKLLGAEIPIMAVLGDQQASLFGHGCNRPGLMKCTYGTGSFLVAHTGTQIMRSHHQLLSTVAWTQATQTGAPEVGYALEGSMFTTGACIQWLRDGIKLIQVAADTERMANQVADNGGVYFVPALSGLGAPHWDMSARGAFLGLTGGVRQEHMVRAVLEAIAYQVKEVVQAMNECSSHEIKRLKADGGACENNFLMQFQADVLGIPVDRPVVRDTTVQGIALAAGLAVGFWDNYETLVSRRQIDRVFEPSEQATPALENFVTWQKALTRAKHWSEE